MALVDPFGVILADLKANAALIAVVPAARISREYTSAPCVVLTDLATTRRPFGPGSGAVGLQLWLGIAKCYGPDDTTGRILARQVAGLVSDALHGKGHRTGTSNRHIVRSWAPDIDGTVREPQPPVGTALPRYDVRIEAYAGAGAVA